MNPIFLLFCACICLSLSAMIAKSDDLANQIVDFTSIPIEVRMQHIFPHIHGQTLEDTLQLRKTFLLTNKQHAARLNNRKFTESQLPLLQEKYNRSMLEIANLIKPPTAKEFAKELEQKAEASWQEYKDASKKDTIEHKEYEDYMDYLFKKKRNNEIPSFLYYIYAKSSHCQEAYLPYREDSFILGSLNPWNCTKPIERFKHWIKSGLLRQNLHRENFWANLIHCGYEEPEFLDYTRMLINAGYAGNTFIKPQYYSWVPITILDETFFRINLVHVQIGRASEPEYRNDPRTQEDAQNKIVNLLTIARHLVASNAQSIYEIENPELLTPELQKEAGEEISQTQNPFILDAKIAAFSKWENHGERKLQPTQKELIKNVIALKLLLNSGAQSQYEIKEIQKVL